MESVSLISTMISKITTITKGQPVYFQIILSILVAFGIWAYYKVGVSKNKPLDSINIKLDKIGKDTDRNTEVIVELTTVIETNRDIQATLHNYDYKLSALANRKLQLVSNTVVKKFLSNKSQEIISLHNSMQQRGVDVKHLEYWLNLIDGKTQEYIIKAIDMVGFKWSSDFNRHHKERTEQFQDELKFLYEDIENNKIYRLYADFANFIDDTISHAVAIEYAERKINAKRY